jgi:transketolase
LLKGAYVLSPERGNEPDAILIASGSELHLALAAQDLLRAQGDVDARVVSMPSWELFREQPQDYRDAVLPPQVAHRLAVEAGVSMGWCEWVGGAGEVIGQNRFGASAPGKENFKHFGFTAEHIAARLQRMVGK